MRSDGIAKFTLCPPVICSVAIPITCPCMFTTGLPLEPDEIGAVIWIIRPNVGMSRTAETMPFVTLPSSPSGLPMTTMLSPSCGEVLSSGNGLIGVAGGSIFRRAMSPSASTASTPLTGNTVPVDEWISARCAPSRT